MQLTPPVLSHLHAIVLAAGKGTRMKSDLPKVLHKLTGTPLILHVLSSIEKSGIKSASLVIGHGRDLVRSTVEDWAKDKATQLSFVIQEEQKGTGHAVQVARSSVPTDKEAVIILLGDVPRLSSEVIEKSYGMLINENADGLVISMNLEDPTGYGRVVRFSNGSLDKIVEQKDASEEEKKISEVNTGVFVFSAKGLWEELDKISDANAQGEYYLTDIVAIMNQSGKKFIVYQAEDASQFEGINSPEQLARMEEQISSTGATS